MSEHFTCDNCGGTFKKGRPDHEADAEALERFGVVPDPATRGVLCDDCDKLFLAWLETPAGKRTMEEWEAAGKPT